MYRIAGIFSRAKFSFLVIDWISSVLIPFFRITDKPCPFCLNKTCVQFSFLLVTEQKNETLAERNMPAIR